MAISSGVFPHRAWVTIGGQQFPLLSGSANQAATRKSSTFSGTLPLGYPGAEETFAKVTDEDASVLVLSKGQQKALVTGSIDSPSFDYTGGIISFNGRCKSSKLHEKKTSEKWVNKKHHEIAQELAERVGLKTNFDAGTLNAGRMMQIDWTKLTDGVSYSTAIQKIAEFLGARWWVDPQGTMHMKSPENAEGSYPIFYQDGHPKRADILQLKITRNIHAGKPVKVNVKSFHAGKKKTFTGTYNIGGAGQTVEYNYHLPGHQQEHVDKHAKSKAKEHARHELQLSATMVGDPSIDVAKKLQLNGTRFAQAFDMDSVNHSFGMSGHTMSVTAKSAKQGRS